LKSSNGTVLNGKTIEPGKTYPFKAGDRIDLPSFALICDITPDPPPDPVELPKAEGPPTLAAPAEQAKDELTEEPDEFAVPPQNSQKQQADKKIRELLIGIKEEKPFIVVVDGADKGQQIRLQKMGQKLILGRTKECDLYLKHPTISKRHAQLHWDMTGVSIRDLGSVNGTFVNEERVTDRHVYLRDQDTVRLGTEKLMFVNPLTPTTTAGLDLDDNLDTSGPRTLPPQVSAVAGAGTPGSEQIKQLAAESKGAGATAPHAKPEVTPAPTDPAKDSPAAAPPPQPEAVKPAAKQPEGGTPPEAKPAEIKAPEVKPAEQKAVEVKVPEPAATDKKTAAAEPATANGKAAAPAAKEDNGKQPATAKAPSPVIIYIIWALGALFVIGGITLVVLLFMS